MKKLVYPLMLWLLCLLQALPLSSAESVALMLISLCLSALALCLPDRPKLALCLAWQAACLLYAPLLPYLPLSAFLLCELTLNETEWKLLALTWLIVLLRYLPAFSLVIPLALLCLLACLLAFSAHSLAREKRRFFALQDETTEKARTLEQKNRLLLEKQDYQVQLATLTERSRLAREIHDNVGHLLTRALYQISALQVMQPQNKEALGQVKATLDDAMSSIRASVHDLHSDAMDLHLELQKLIDAFPACPVTLRYDCTPVPPAVHYCFIAVAKEALSNIARHSNATCASISVLEHPALYQMIIEDNGTAQPARNAPGIGLQNIEERVSALQGIFRITTDRGYRLFLSIPKTRPEVAS